MAKNKKSGTGFKKGGYKKRSGRPVGYSRSGLPKLFPANVNTFLRAIKIG